MNLKQNKIMGGLMLLVDGGLPLWVCRDVPLFRGPNTERGSGLLGSWTLDPIHPLEQCTDPPVAPGTAWVSDSVCDRVWAQYVKERARLLQPMVQRCMGFLIFSSGWQTSVKSQGRENPLRFTAWEDKSPSRLGQCMDADHRLLTPSYITES